MDVEHTVETIIVRVACEHCRAVTWRAEIAPDEPCPRCGGEFTPELAYEVPVGPRVI